jgi:peptide/nickel transport system ATP-binding protein/peptide/nickel transport system permease protein
VSSAWLEVEDLRVDLPALGGAVPAVAGASFRLERGRSLALVGESGSGKTTAALTLPRLLPSGTRVAARRLEFGGRDLRTPSERDLVELRGRVIGIVFQDAGASLDPVLRVGPQVTEGPRKSLGLGRAEARARALELLAEVGLSDPEGMSQRFPHQLSGGQRQRVALAMALASGPALLVADEPTTALDVTLQAQVLELLSRLATQRGMALLLVSHDLAVVARAADEVAVMYAGRVVERGPSAAVLARPRHPYTRALLRAQPGAVPRGARLQPIPGAVGDLRRLPSGCAFRLRCPLARERCAASEPPLESVPGQPGVPGEQRSACFFAAEVPPP